jgi:hypothetical protein
MTDNHIRALFARWRAAVQGVDVSDLQQSQERITDAERRFVEGVYRIMPNYDVDRSYLGKPGGDHE